MPTIKFINEKKEIQVPEGTNLRKAAVDAGVNLYQGINGFGASINKYVNCYGFGLCGTCAVSIAKGMENTNKMTLREKMKFKGIPVPDLTALHFIGHEDTMRLGCVTTVHGDVEVLTGPPLNLYGENFFS